MNREEENIRKKFQGYEEPPSPGVWESIERELDRNKKGAGFFKKYLTPLVATIALMAGTGGYLLWQSQSTWQNSVTGGSKNAEVKQEKSVASDKQDKVSARDLKDNSGKNENKSKKENKGNYRAAGDENKYIDSQGDKVNEDTKLQKGAKEGTNKQVALNKNEIEVNKRKQATNNQNQKSEFASSDLPRKLSALSPLNHQTSGLEKANLVDDLGALNDSLQKEFYSSDNDNQFNKWRIGILGGYFYENYRYHVKEGYSETRDMLDKSEKPAWGYGFALKGYYAPHSRWEFTLGVGYERYTQKFSHTFKGIFYRKSSNWEDGGNSIEQSNGSDHVNLVPTSAGDPVDDSNREKIFNINHESSYEFLTLPFGVRYKVIKGDFSLYLGAGGRMAYLAAVNTQFLGTRDNLIYDIENPENNLLKRVRLNVDFNAGLEYEILPKLNLTVIPSASTGIGSIYQDNFPVEKKPYRIGLDVGMIYEF